MLVARTAHCTFFGVDIPQAARAALWSHNALIYLAWFRENKLRSR